MTVSESFQSFISEISSCRDLRSHALAIPNTEQKRMIYESILLRCFRSYENFIESSFLKYLIDNFDNPQDVKYRHFASPYDFNHARKMVSFSGGSQYPDWSDPNKVRARSNVFLNEDHPLGLAIGGKTAEIKWMQKIRNHIAHNSKESIIQFQKVIKGIMIVPVSPTPSPGEFLSYTPKRGPLKNREVLAGFIDIIEETACSVASVDPKRGSSTQIPN